MSDETTAAGVSLIGELDKIARAATELGAAGVSVTLTETTVVRLGLEFGREGLASAESHVIAQSVAGARDKSPGLVGRWRGVNIYREE